MIDRMLYETESLLLALEDQEAAPHPLCNIRAATEEVYADEKQQLILEHRILVRLLREHVTLDMIRDSLRKWTDELRAGNNPFHIQT